PRSPTRSTPPAPTATPSLLDALPSSDCHVNNNYNFTSANTDCYGCHQAAWNSTPTFGGNVPNHITASFPTSLCSSCHDTVLWSDERFSKRLKAIHRTNSHAVIHADKV